MLVGLVLVCWLIILVMIELVIVNVVCNVGSVALFLVMLVVVVRD